MRKSVSALAGLAAGILLCSAAAAQDHSLSGPARDARIAELAREATLGRTVALPANAAALDAALARRDYHGLRSQMGASTAADAELMLNWAKIAVFKGEPSFVSLIYAGDLWRMAEALERAAVREPANAAALGEQARNLKTLSAMMGLHAAFVMDVDGARCVDSHAADGMRAELDVALAPQWAFARTLPTEYRARMIRSAAILEAKTAPVREPDYRLCASGTAEMTAIAGGRAQPVDDPATPGADFAVEGDPNTLVIGNAQWWGKADPVRQAASATAARTLDVPLNLLVQ